MRENKRSTRSNVLLAIRICIQLHGSGQALESGNGEKSLNSIACALDRRLFCLIRFVDGFSLSLYSNTVANGSDFAKTSQNNHDSRLSVSKGVNFFHYFLSRPFCELFMQR